MARTKVEPDTEVLEPPPPRRCPKCGGPTTEPRLVRDEWVTGCDRDRIVFLSEDHVYPPSEGMVSIDDSFYLERLFEIISQLKKWKIMTDPECQDWVWPRPF
jgi:hypothetical protein